MRQSLQLTDSTHPTIYSQTLSTNSRVIWTQNTELAKSMLQRDVVAEHFMEFSEGKIILKNNEEFSAEIANSKLTILDTRRQVVANSSYQNKDKKMK